MFIKSERLLREQNLDVYFSYKTAGTTAAAQEVEQVC